MCGIAGFLSVPSLKLGDERALRLMVGALTHRGPDDQGEWLDPSAGVALGHRRLAVIDLSSAGHQPMTSHSGRFVVTYNGEIYNYADLRTELEGLGQAPNWRGHSDTEVMLAAIDHWGVRGTLQRLNGMFALAVWDRARRVLTLARDRLGEKPLYYGRMGSTLLFGSELKALTAHPAFEQVVDRDALTLFLRHNYVPAPFSIWRGISKLPPAHAIEVGAAGQLIGEPFAYWDFRAIAEAGAADPLKDTPELVDGLEELLRDAVRRRMEADVPLGAFLSGGVDSSAVVALMQAQSARPVRTFTIGFHDKGYNEAVHARAVADHLGTDHTELYVTPDDALSVIPRLSAIWDEPFSDSSQIPTYLVAELARRDVTVSLSGDGGDELFAGYDRYFRGSRIWKAMSGVPSGVRRTAGALLSAPVTERALGGLARLMPGRTAQLSDRLPKLGQMLSESSPVALYERLVSHFKEPDRVVVGGSEPRSAVVDGMPGFASFLHSMMYIDTLTYLPDDILVKVDRATMAVSLESRVPLLDHRVVEFAWRVPISAKIRGGRGKHILREVLHRHVPAELIDRPKMGFGVPIELWLRGALRDWGEELLDESRLRNEGFFDPAPIRKLWTEHVSGQRRWHYYLWDVLMFQAWLEANGSTAPVESAPRLREAV